MESMGSLVSIESPCWSNDHFVLCAKCCMIQRFRQKWCTAAVKGNSQIGQLRATTGFPIIYARTCSSFLARFTLVWVGWKPQCCRDSTGLVPQIHLTNWFGIPQSSLFLCVWVCGCVRAYVPSVGLYIPFIRGMVLNWNPAAGRLLQVLQTGLNTAEKEAPPTHVSKRQGALHPAHLIFQSVSY